MIYILEVTKVTELECPSAWNFKHFVICELSKVQIKNSMYRIELNDFIVIES